VEGGRRKKKATWGEVLAHATGALGLKPAEFWRLTWAEYEAMCEGYSKQREQEYRARWETTRWMTFHLLNIQIAKRKDKLKRLTDLVRFPWEAKQEYRMPTREEYLSLIERWGRTLA